MKASVILNKQYAEPPFCEKEILRYAGCKDGENGISELLRECIEEIRGKLLYKVCFRELSINVSGSVCDFGFVKVHSAALAKNLHGCEDIIVFAATVGLELDRIIAKYGKLSPAKALMLQAIGAERIEALCDAFCLDIGEEKQKSGLFLKPRFSPGYGDLPLDIQKDIFSVLDCPKQIGLMLNNSMLMSPSKSVTAIIGLTKEKKEKTNDKCSLCESIDCSFRRLR